MLSAPTRDLKHYSAKWVSKYEKPGSKWLH